MSDFFNNCFYLSLLLTNPFETKKFIRQQSYRPISPNFLPLRSIISPHPKATKNNTHFLFAKIKRSEASRRSIAQS